MKMHGVALAAAMMAGATPALAEKYPKIQKEVVFAPTADHAADAARLIGVVKPGVAKGISKVVIPFFQIQFVTDSDASASNIDGNSSQMQIRLKGASDAQMQAITDRLYARFVADLTAAGLTVVPVAEVAALPEWNTLMKRPSGQAIDGMNNVNSKFFAPTGMGYYFLPTQKIEYSGGGMWSGMEYPGTQQAEQKLMASTGAALVGFRAVVDFGSVKSGNNGFFGRLRYTTSTKSKAAITVRPGGTQLWVMTPGKGSMTDPLNSRLRLSLQAPLLIDTQAITAMRNANTTGDRVGMAAVNVMSALMGGGMHSAKKFDVVVDPAVWERDVAGALEGVEQMLVTRLRGEL